MIVGHNEKVMQGSIWSHKNDENDHAFNCILRNAFDNNNLSWMMVDDEVVQCILCLLINRAQIR